MNLSLKKIVQSSFFTQKKYISFLWIIVALVSALKQFKINKFNNYSIFKHVYYHTLEKVSLYAEYPTLYFDHNHYGPVFSIVIAPFAILPDAVGMALWSVFNALLLVWAIYKLPLKDSKINLILWICAHEFLTTILGFQFNPIMTSIIILSYVYINEEKDFWSAFLIILGTFIKLYGIVGLAFFFFSKNKLKFISSLVIWSIILFVLPMLISSPQFIIDSYVEWFQRLAVKNNENASLVSMQDISVMGMFRRIVQNPNLSNVPFLISGLVLFGLPYLRYKMFNNPKFRLLLLSSVLIFTVIFSSGSESPTYIIAFVGVAIWFVIQNQPASKFTWFLFILAIILTSFSASDLMPRYLYDHFIFPYALKALPCILIWLRIVYEMLTMKKEDSNENIISFT